MRRAIPFLVAFAVLAQPLRALAHDPLDDETGEEDFVQKVDTPHTSERKEREEREMAKVLQEREDLQFQLNQEKEEFLRDRAETRDVMAGIRRRNELAGTGSARPHAVAPPAPHRVEPTAAHPAKAPDHDAAGATQDPPRGDVDPTDPSGT